MNLIKHLDKNNLHHAYLIEGEREAVLPKILEFVSSLKIDINANPDFVNITVDSFKIEDARNLKSFGSERSFSGEKNAKKIFIISANSFLLEAEQSLLKIFEEPIENTHFFIVVPDTNSLLKTFVSRFYLIKNENPNTKEDEALKFINMSLQKRIDFIKELLPKKDDEDEEVNAESNNSKALKFLNALEFSLHSKLLKNFSGLLQPQKSGAGTFPVQNSLIICYEHFFKVREFLRMPGSSPKTLMESVALIIPEKI